MPGGLAVPGVHGMPPSIGPLPQALPVHSHGVRAFQPNAWVWGNVADPAYMPQPSSVEGDIPAALPASPKGEVGGPDEEAGDEAAAAAAALEAISSGVQPSRQPP